MSTTSVRYASEFDASGYAIAARRCFNALVDQGLDPSWEALTEIAGYGRSRTSVAIGAPIEMRAKRRAIDNGELAIFHCVPQSWERLRSELEPDRVIGHVVWECEQIPSRWRHELEAADELWVPTEWNRAAFATAFDGPIHVVPHIVDERFSATPPINVSDDRPIVAIVSAWDWRKRPDLTIKAALTAFAGNNDVLVVVKTTTTPIGWPHDQRAPVQQIADIVQQVPNAPAVLVDDADWTDAEMLGLLERANCFFSLTSSEGWGLGAFDAATRGTPVVVTGFGGQVEWLGSDYPGLVPYTLVDADHPDTTLFEPGMKWASAQFDEAIDLVRSVINNSNSEIRDAATQLAQKLRDRYSTPAVGGHISKILDPLVKAVVHEAVTTSDSSQNSQKILVLTPFFDSSSDVSTYVAAVTSMRASGCEIEVVIGTSETDVSLLESVTNQLHDSGIDARVEIITSTNESSLRNRLLFAALDDHDWVLWLDSSVIHIPKELIDITWATDADVVQPLLVNEQGEEVQSPASTDRGDAPLAVYRGRGAVTLHGVDARMVLVRADCHREGLMWPAFSYGEIDPRSRIDPNLVGRYELGEIETEGLGLLAGAMGYTVLGLPDVEIIHE